MCELPWLLLGSRALGSLTLALAPPSADRGLQGTTSGITGAGARPLPCMGRAHGKEVGR